MIYFDTSFLAPLVLLEATSDEVAALFGQLDALQFAVSYWTVVEFASLVAREVRMGGLDAAAAAKADLRFEALVYGSFTVLLPSAEDFVLAKRYLGRFDTGLRSGNALHLAIAKNHGAGTIYSLDRGLLKAGDLLGLPVRRGIETT